MIAVPLKIALLFVISFPQIVAAEDAPAEDVEYEKIVIYSGGEGPSGQPTYLNDLILSGAIPRLGPDGNNSDWRRRRDAASLESFEMNRENWDWNKIDPQIDLAILSPLDFIGPAAGLPSVGRAILKTRAAARLWFRAGPSNSSSMGKTALSIRWGSNSSYRKKIRSEYWRRQNKNLHDWQIPIKSWRTVDEGHFHIWRKGEYIPRKGELWSPLFLPQDYSPLLEE